MIHQEHCNNCVQISKCVLSKSIGDICKIVACELDCGAQFHSCKLSEHQLLCPKEKVPCINESSGCPAVIPRYQRTKHLKNCPANVVVCGMGWNRLPLLNIPDCEPADCDLLHSPKAGKCQPDAGLAMKDQFTFQSWLANIALTLPHFVYINPVVFIEDGEVSDIFTGKFSSDTLYTEYGSTATSLSKFNHGLSPFAVVNKTIYHFACVQLFRREDYMWHSKNVHCDIHGSVNGWIEHRCPLSYLGCAYSLRRLYPNHPTSYIVQDMSGNFGLSSENGECEDEVVTMSAQEGQANFGATSSLGEKSPIETLYSLEKITIKESTCSLGEKSSTESLRPSELLDLPFEVLVYLFLYLDPFSIRNVAATCKLLHSVCFAIVRLKGIVVLDWERSQSGNIVRWNTKTKRWLFPAAFTPIYRWGMEATSGAMAEHLMVCPYNERKELPSEPVKVIWYQ